MEKKEILPQGEMLAATERWLPGTDVVGHGYDATKHYANAECVTLPIFDVGPFDSTIVAPNGKTYALPSSIEKTFTLTDMAHGKYHHISGESAEEYRKSLSIKVEVSGSYGLFSGSVKSHYESKELASFNHSFVTLYHHYDMWKIGLPDISTMSMLPSVKDDIDGVSNLSPAEVIKKYGTHIIAEAVIGGRARYTCFVDRSKYISEVSMVVAAEASYKGILKLDARMETQYKTAVEKFRSSSRTDFDTIGGDFKADFDPASFVQWINSFKEHPVLVDFTERSLVEIYKLASNKQRREELEKAFVQYIKESEKLVPDDIPLLEVIIFHSGDKVCDDKGSGARQDLAVYKPKLQSGWNWIGQSANQNSNFLIVKPLVPGAVVAPLGYDKVWDDHGSSKYWNYSLWNIVAPPHYRALGGMARLGMGRDYNPPSGGEVAGLVCIHESICTEGKIGDGRIWQDKGSNASWDGSVWPIVPKDENGIATYTFYSARGYSKPNPQVYVIKKENKVKIT